MKNPTKIILTLVAAAILIILVVVLTNKQSSESNTPGIKTTNENLLVGNWIRTDFEYRISISKINEDGTLAAQYFNPNQINVGKASWAESYGNLKIIIELRDVNYPGSTYTLNYLPDRDMLAGEYYQAVEGLTFYVEFIRKH
ncbi:MAG: hypothetical protein IH618_09205 [Ignavibacteriaceae bacterium]|nr:hypothetical protein [Ignavibacteriaceae bacterium]